MPTDASTSANNAKPENNSISDREAAMVSMTRWSNVFTLNTGWFLSMANTSLRSARARSGISRGANKERHSVHRHLAERHVDLGGHIRGDAFLFHVADNADDGGKDRVHNRSRCACLRRRRRESNAAQTPG